MNQLLIVVVNRGLARFFTLDPVEFPELESGPRISFLHHRRVCSVFCILRWASLPGRDTKSTSSQKT